MEQVQSLSGIDPWFLGLILDLVRVEGGIRAIGDGVYKKANLRELKRRGFSDARIGALCGKTEGEVREARLANDIRPVYKRVDTCAAEFASSTAYLYSTYEQYCESDTSDKR